MRASPWAFHFRNNTVYLSTIELFNLPSRISFRISYSSSSSCWLCLRVNSLDLYLVTMNATKKEGEKKKKSNEISEQTTPQQDVF